MSNVKYDIKRVSRELLEQYACQQLCMTQDSQYPIYANSPIGKQVVKAAEVPLRTRAQIDADIAEAVRKYGEFKAKHQHHDESIFISKAYSEMNGPIITIDRDVKALLAEETSD